MSCAGLQYDIGWLQLAWFATGLNHSRLAQLSFPVVARLVAVTANDWTVDRGGCDCFGGLQGVPCNSYMALKLDCASAACMMADWDCPSSGVLQQGVTHGAWGFVGAASITQHAGLGRVKGGGLLLVMSHNALQAPALCFPEAGAAGRREHGRGRLTQL